MASQRPNVIVWEPVGRWKVQAKRTWVWTWNGILNVHVRNVLVITVLVDMCPPPGVRREDLCLISHWCCRATACQSLNTFHVTACSGLSDSQNQGSGDEVSV
jgi:hypothetical protein